MARWYYDDAYRDMFRHHTKLLRKHELENYTALIGGEAFIVLDAAGKEPMGYVQVIPSHKHNRSFEVGMLIDKKFQKNRNPCEVLVVLFEYMFHKLGFHKAVIEILESNTSLKKTLVAAGFMSEGRLVDESYMDGKYVNELRFAMFDSYYNKHYKQKLAA